MRKWWKDQQGDIFSSFCTPTEYNYVLKIVCLFMHEKMTQVLRYCKLLTDRKVFTFVFTSALYTAGTCSMRGVPDIGSARKVTMYP